MAYLFEFCFWSYIENNKVVFFLKAQGFLHIHTPYLQILAIFLDYILFKLLCSLGVMDHLDHHHHY